MEMHFFHFDYRERHVFDIYFTAHATNMESIQNSGITMSE